jgi:hypothetical protein
MASSEKEWPHRPELVRAKYSGSSGGLVEREASMRSLASQLLFTVERTGKRFTLVRTIDVSEPVRCNALTLAEAEDFLRTWKLGGLRGG